jgi:hypothetical protein
MGWRCRLLCWQKRETITPVERKSGSCYRYGLAVLKKTDQAECVLFYYTGCKLFCRESKQVKRKSQKFTLIGAEIANIPRWTSIYVQKLTVKLSTICALRRLYYSQVLISLKLHDKSNRNARHLKYSPKMIRKLSYVKHGRVLLTRSGSDITLTELTTCSTHLMISCASSSKL